MSATQLTPKPTILELVTEKSLPSLPSEQQQSQNSQTMRLFASKQLPDKPVLARHWTLAAIQPCSSENSSLALDSNSPLALSSNSSFATNFTTLDPQATDSVHATRPLAKNDANLPTPSNRSSITATVHASDLELKSPLSINLPDIDFDTNHSPQNFYSPFLFSDESPKPDVETKVDDQNHTEKTSKPSESKCTDTMQLGLKPSRPSLQNCWKSSGLLVESKNGVHAFGPSLPSPENASPAPASVALNQSYFSGLPDPSSFPLPTASQMMASGSDSPSSRQHSHFTRSSSHYSSDMSARNSTSTRGSLWTERSLTSCGTSPAGLTNSLIGIEQFTKPTFADGEVEVELEGTEEIDEHSVGLGITSDFEQLAGSRRSSAAPIIPSTNLPQGSPALSGPFSHHRVPSWTRRSDLSNLVMSLTPNLSPESSNEVQQSILRPRQPSRYSSHYSNAEERSVPNIPLRRESRPRCSSDSSRRLSHTKNSPSTSSSVSSASKRSGFQTPASVYTFDLLSKGGLTRTFSNSTSSSANSGQMNPAALPSPPRVSSLRHSPSVSSFQSTSTNLEAAIESRSICIKPFNPVTDSLFSAQQGSANVCFPTIQGPTCQVQASSESSSSSSASIESVREAAKTLKVHSRSVSDVSINSFLHGQEFSHILGAYVERFRWDDYSFDESIENQDEEPQAVKTAKDGSAAIVNGNERTVAEIESEIGPKTTHLVLRCCMEPELLDMLERVLPSTEKLLVLDLSGCNLTALPSAIANCTCLEELDISRNPIGTIPDWIGNLEPLRMLSADSIGTRALPQSLSQLQELQHLAIRANLFTHLPSWLHRLPKLDRLFLEGNPFKGVWNEIVTPLMSCRRSMVIKDFSMPSSAIGLPHVKASQNTLSNTVTPSRDSLGTRRLRSSNDLQKLVTSLEPLSMISPSNNEQRPAEGSEWSSPIEGLVNSAGFDFDDRLKALGVHPDISSSRPVTSAGATDSVDLAASVGKWGFLKKIGRKASSSKLQTAFTDHSPTDSRSSSPRSSRASLGNSGGASRPRSRAGSASQRARESLLLKGSVMTPLSELRAVENVHVPLTPLTPSLPQEPEASTLKVNQPRDLLLATPRNIKRRSFLPVSGFDATVAMNLPDKHERQDSSGIDHVSVELDEQALSQHRYRLRALLHYLKDLDDLTSVKKISRHDGDSPNQSPRIKQKPSLSALGGGNVCSSVAMARKPSVNSAMSSAPSMMSKFSVSQSSTVASSPQTDQASATEFPLDDQKNQECCSSPLPKDDSVRRIRIIQEIVQTEETYVKGLGELVDIYVRPAQHPLEGGNGLAVVPQAEQRAVFGNVEAILQFHRDVFLPSLTSAARPLLHKVASAEMDPAQTAAAAENIATVFTRHAAFFKMYMSYINNCDSAQSRINVWMSPSSVIHAAAAFKAAGLNQPGSATPSANMAATSLNHDFGLNPGQRKKLKSFMKKCRSHPRHSQLNVESYLLLPVQRIPRYRLLLEDLVRSTDRSRLKDSESLSTALDHVTQIASNVNESKRQSEQDRKLLTWQYRIRGSFDAPLVQPHRRLIKDGHLQLKRVVRRIPAFVRQVNARSMPGASFESPAEQEPIVQVDHLEQSSENLPMSLLVCNDIIVAAVDPSRGQDQTAPVRLYTLLKLEKSAEIVGGINLRLVDRKEILYFATSSPEEAVAWKTAFNHHFY